MLCLYFHSSGSIFQFPFYFFFDPLIVRECVVYFSPICGFPEFLHVLDFWFHSTVARENTFQHLYSFELIEVIVWPSRWSILQNVSSALEEDCSLLPLGKVFCTNWLDLVGLYCYSSISLLIFLLFYALFKLGYWSL